MHPGLYKHLIQDDVRPEAIASIPAQAACPQIRPPAPRHLGPASFLRILTTLPTESGGVDVVTRSYYMVYQTALQCLVCGTICKLTREGAMHDTHTAASPTDVLPTSLTTTGFMTGCEVSSWLSRYTALDATWREGARGVATPVFNTCGGQGTSQARVTTACVTTAQPHQGGFLRTT